MKKNDFFVTSLLDWSTGVERDLPWKASGDPYKIWLSEVILQQTRVSQGRPYYLRFIDKYPTVQSLAAASEDDVLFLWKGLGYYARARNMLNTAKQIVEQFDGVIPNDYDAVLSLKGIGPYTAAAILSFSFNSNFAVVDGNVVRVLSRYFGITEPVDIPVTRKVLQNLADDLLLHGKAAIYNQAIINFGALACKPKKPICLECPLSSNCVAFKKSLVSEIPLKKSKIVKRERFFHFLVLRKDDQILIERRNSKDIWNGLYQFPLFEVNNEGEKPDFASFSILSEPSLIEKRTQILTHQKIYGYFWVSDVITQNEFENRYEWIQLTDLDKIAVPRIIDMFLKQNLLSLI